MPSVRSVTLVLTVLCLLGQGSGQISFSPNWGTGKRSSPMGTERDCWGKSDMRALYDVVKLIQKQADSLARCISREDEDGGM